jgi:hypothetical protein
MKNLLFITSFGLAVVFSNAAIGQDVKDGDSTKKEVKVNSRSNGKNNANRTFGKERAATVQEMNGDNGQIADKKEEKAAAKIDKKEEKNKQKEARKAEKERLKAEKHLAKKNKSRK